MEVVATYLQLFEAEAACAALRAAGIPAEVLDRNLGTNMPYLTQTGIRVAVPLDRLQIAREILAGLTAEAEPLPPEDVIPPRQYGKAWMIPGVLTLLCLWETSRLLRLLGDGAIAEVSGLMVVLLAALGAAGFGVAAVFAWNRRSGTSIVYLTGWACTLASQIVLAVAYPTGLDLPDLIGAHFIGYVATLVLGIAVMSVESKENWGGEAPASAA